MPRVILDNVSVDFPILHMSNRSLKKVLVAKVTGGAILHEAKAAPMVRALSGISAMASAGDRIGLVGPNGAGKTTLLRVIAGIYEPSFGQLYTEGSVVPLLDLVSGFNLDMTGRENTRLRCRYMGLTPAHIREVAPEIEAFTELGGYLDMPLRTYSSGMLLRLSFAIATCTQPDILLLDEWILVGDAPFMAKAQARLQAFVSSAGILLLAAHSEPIIRQWCNKAIFLKGGEMRAFGEVGMVLDTYTADRSGDV